MSRRIGRVVALTMAACLVIVLTACVTSDKYKLAKENVQPARLLGWNVVEPPAELLLETLIVFKGPGSWKQEARWDEYVVMLINRGTQPLRIETATLTDLLGQPQVPGDNPWVLEKTSYTNWDNYGKEGMQLLAGAGIALYYSGTILFLAFAGLASAAALTALLVAAPVVMVADVATVQVINQKNMDKVQTEFDRRRLVLPVEIAPGASREGSFFFPMTPGPQRLVVKGRVDGVPLDLILEFKQLAGLHLKPAEKK